MYLTLGYRFDGSTRVERVIRGTKEDIVGCCVSNSRLFDDELAFVRGITSSKNTRYSSSCREIEKKRTAKLVHLPTVNDVAYMYMHDKVIHYSICAIKSSKRLRKKLMKQTTI